MDKDFDTIYLDLTGKDIKFEKEYTALKYLIANKSFFNEQTPGEMLSLCPSLECLWVKNSNVVVIPKLEKLRKLYINGCNIQSLPHLYKLQVLIANDSDLDTIPSELISLEKLSIKNTSIGLIPINLLSLEWLSIASTKIIDINSCDFIEYLDISNTNYDFMSNHSKFKNLKKIKASNVFIDPLELGCIEILN